MSKELKITKEKVLEASKQCEEARGVLKAMFPGVFEEEWVDITVSCNVEIKINERGSYLGIFHDGEEIMTQTPDCAENNGELTVTFWKPNTKDYKVSLGKRGENFRIFKKKI